MNGFSVSTAGDVNGDGLDDLIIGSHRVDLNGKSEVGKSYVIFGKTNTNATLRSDIGAPTIKSSKPSPLTSPALETELPLQPPAFSPIMIRRRCQR
jgi:hypothetical protein